MDKGSYSAVLRTIVWESRFLGNTRLSSTPTARHSKVRIGLTRLEDISPPISHGITGQTTFKVSRRLNVVDEIVYIPSRVAIVLAKVG